MEVTLKFKAGITRSEMLAQFVAVFGEPTILNQDVVLGGKLYPSQAIEKLPNVALAGNVSATPFPTLHADDNPEAGAPLDPGYDRTSNIPLLDMTNRIVINDEPTAAQVFGGAPLPNVAPASAGADQLLTAHAAPISMPPGFVPSLNAPLPGNAATALAGNVTPSNPAVNVDLDAEGLPWDERIHSSNRQKTAKDVWRAKRNVSPALETQVKAELLRTLSLGAAPTTAQQLRAFPNQAHVVDTFPGQVHDIPALPGAIPGQLPASASPDPWVAFSVWVGTEIDAGRLTAEKVTNLAKLWGLTDANGNGSVALLAHKLDWLDAFKKALDPIPAGAL